MGSPRSNPGARRRLLRAALLALLAVPAGAEAVRIPNVAVATYQVGAEREGERRPSNEVEVLTIPGPTPGVVTFHQYAPEAPQPQILPADGGSCADAAGNFAPLPPPVLLDGQPLSLAAPLPVIDARAFHAGEPIVVGLVDPNRNVDETRRDHVEVRLRTEPGDEERLLLQETGPDTGRFAGVIQSMPMPPAPVPFNCQLSVSEATQLWADYQDPYYPEDTSQDLALVDPYGVVFDSSTGAPVDGVPVTLVDAVTGQPARVFGDDGRSTFPATVPSGGEVQDSSGRRYRLPPGNFRFPYVMPGRYRLVVAPPPQYTAPSSVPLDALLALPGPYGRPYAVVTGSRGDVFVITPGPALNIDIPVDPLNSILALQKTGSHATATAGDFVRFRLTLANRSATTTATNVTVQDTLPPALRFVPGSLRVGGVPAADPAIGPDGRTLAIPVATLAPGASLEIVYVVQVGAIDDDTIAVNLAAARGDDGVVSNPARAAVHVRPPLLSGRFTVIGRVVEGSCDTPWEQLAGVPGARVLLEDGTYVATDADGQFHFKGVRAGTHVVQLDLASLPADLEPAPCIQNSRFAGRSWSQFVEAQGGALWRTDFYVRRKPPLAGVVGIRLDGAPAGNGLTYRLALDGGAVAVRNLKAMALLPADGRYVPGSARVDGSAAPDPEINGGVAVFRLGDPGSHWRRTVEYTVEAAAPAAGDGGAAPQLLSLASHFDTRRATLTPAGAAALDRLADGIVPANVDAIEVAGHTDAVPIAPANRREFADNHALSLARARTVADALARRLGLPAEQVRVRGHGADHPLAGNGTAAGRAKNRRVEIVVHRRAAPVSAAAPSALRSKALASFDTDTAANVTTPLVEHAAGGDGGARHTVAVQAAPRAAATSAAVPTAEPVAEDVAAAGGNVDWLASATPGTGWLFPPEDHNPRAPSLRVAIRHPPGLSVRLRRGGTAVPLLAFDGATTRADGAVAVSVWRGIELEDGDNRLEAEFVDAAGATVEKLERTIHYANTPAFAELVPERSVLVADGLRRPVIAVRLLDRNRRPVRTGVTGPLVVTSGQVPAQRDDWQQQRALSGMERFAPVYRVEGDDGIALIELQPTTDSGAVVLEFTFESRRQELRSWLQPEARDWIVVGFAAGTAGYETLSGHAEPLAGPEDGLTREGQVSLYAKGRVRGEWLLTVAYDTDKPAEPLRRERLLSTIDPHEFYTLYGDATEQRHDASSQSKLYVKLERAQFYALFGDFQTGLDEARLSRYSRTLSGIKSEFQGERWSYRAFAADTPQNYARDELQGDGTSGLYRLGRRGIVINSEKIRIETRDRLRSERIVQSRPLLRHIDYDIDYGAGTLFFREPVPSRDFQFNPVFIVAEYETVGTADTALNAGGRVGLQLAGGRVRIGASHVHDADAQGSTDLDGADVRVQLGTDTELRLEAATSRGGAAAAPRDGTAWLAEVEHHAGAFDALAYARGQDADFGLRQQNGVESGTTKAGIDARWHLGTSLALQGQAYRQESSASQVRRDVLAARAQYQVPEGGASVGVQSATDRIGAATARSQQLTLAGNRFFFDHRLELSGQADIGLGGANDSVDFPTRYTLGAAWAITDAARLILAQEFSDGEAFDAATTRAGVEVKPWHGARLSTTLNQSQVREHGPRTFAQMGLSQGVLLGERWSLDFGVDGSRTFAESGSTPTPATPGHPFASGGVVGQPTLTEDFWAATAGATYRAPRWTWNGRAETRRAETSRRHGVVTGFLRQVGEGVAVSAAGQLFRIEQTLGAGGVTAALDFGLAVRRPGSQYAVLDRLELRYDELLDGGGLGGPALAASGDARSRRIINNFSLNRVSRQWQAGDNPFVLDQRSQWSLYYGSKYALDDFDGMGYRGYTDLLGLEWRFDLSPRWDLGVQLSQLRVWDAGQTLYSAGPAVGWSPLTNGWLSLGYNFTGFRDRDFDAARYTAQGPYLKLRFKFDQATFAEAAAGAAP